MCLTGRRINGERRSTGASPTCWRRSSGCMDAALELANEIAENAPLAVQSTRATFRAGVAEAVKAQTDHELVEQIVAAQDQGLRRGRPRRERTPAGQLRGGVKKDLTTNLTNHTNGAFAPPLPSRKVAPATCPGSTRRGG